MESLRHAILPKSYLKERFPRVTGIWPCFGLPRMAELFINNRALAVCYEGGWSFPTYTRIRLGAEFGLEGDKAQIPVNYRELKVTFEADGSGNRVILPFVPYGAYENDPYEGVFKPAPPSWKTNHLLGTDSTGRDIMARLVFGFRIAIFFALAFMVLTYLIGITVGCVMGYFGGIFDLYEELGVAYVSGGKLYKGIKEFVNG